MLLGPWSSTSSLQQLTPLPPSPSCCICPPPSGAQEGEAHARERRWYGSVAAHERERPQTGQGEGQGSLAWARIRSFLFLFSAWRGVVINWFHQIPRIWPNRCIASDRYIPFWKLHGSIPVAQPTIYRSGCCSLWNDRERLAKYDGYIIEPHGQIYI
jgi:hypothetical protein